LTIAFQSLVRNFNLVLRKWEATGRWSLTLSFELLKRAFGLLWRMDEVKK
jgi:hypothetical protein